MHAGKLRLATNWFYSIFMFLVLAPSRLLAAMHKLDQDAASTKKQKTGDMKSVSFPARSMVPFISEKILPQTKYDFLEWVPIGCMER